MAHIFLDIIKPLFFSQFLVEGFYFTPRNVDWLTTSIKNDKLLEKLAAPLG
jgi:hypothetical protein